MNASAGRSSQGSGSGYGQSHTPGYTPLSSSAPGENTRQPTHNKLTTEPAKDPFKKDISESVQCQSLGGTNNTYLLLDRFIDAV